MGHLRLGGGARSWEDEALGSDAPSQSAAHTNGSIMRRATCNSLWSYLEVMQKPGILQDAVTINVP